MGVNEKTWPRGQFTLEQVDFLNRNPHYPEWRAAVSKVFAQLDPVLDAEIARSGHARLVIVVAPSQLPADPGRMWTRFQGRGKRVAIEPPEHAEEYLPLLLTGEEQGRSAPTIAQLFAAGKKGGAYTSWIVEAGDGDVQPGNRVRPGGEIQLRSAGPYRKRLMQEVRSVVDSRRRSPVPGNSARA